MASLLSPEVSSIWGRRLEAPGTIIPCKNLPVNGACKVGKRVAGFGIRASSGLKDLKDAKVVNLGQFSAPVKGPSTASAAQSAKEEEDKRNYYLNMGYAIRTLREEFPGLFYNELTFDIYRDDITFKDPLNTFVGIENYKSIFWGLRFHGRIFFRALWIDIISVWQPVDSVIMVRWTVHGVPRVPWESHARFDGTSEYKLDKNGKIYEHQVHNIALRGPPKFRGLSVEDLIHSIGCSSTPKPTYFETSSSSITEILRQVEFKGIEHYVSSLFIGVQASDRENTHVETSSSSITKFVQQVEFKGLEHYVSSLLAGVRASDRERV